MEEDNDCCGVIGRLFGHDYHSMVEFYTPPEDLDKKVLSIVTEFKSMHGAYWSEIISSMDRTVDKIIDASVVKQYKIVCKRCGKGLPNNRENGENENGDFMVKEIG